MATDGRGNEIKPVSIPQGGDTGGNLFVLEAHHIPSGEHWYVPASKASYCKSLIVEGKLTVAGSITVLGD